MQIAALPPAKCLLFPVVLVSFCITLFFGGDQNPGRLPDGFLQVASLPVAVLVVWLCLTRPTDPVVQWSMGLSLVLLAIPLLQLVPLPPSLWTRLPGREIIVAAFETASVSTPWQPISLNPEATWLAFFALVPLLSLFVAGFMLPHRERLVLLVCFIGFACFNVILALLQISVPTIALRIYSTPRLMEDATGVFSGRNNLGVLFYCALPMTLALTVTGAIRRADHRSALVVVGILLGPVLLLGLFTTRSRAGLVLGGFAFVATAVAIFALEVRRFRIHPGVIVTGVLVLAAIGLMILDVSYFRLSQRFDSAVADDLRWPTASRTMSLIWDYMPFGSGYGTFADVFMMGEDERTMRPAFMNHAHNDWLEILLEGGVLSIVALAAALIFITACLRRLVREWAFVDDRVVRTAAAACLIAMLIHTGLEYPLRIQSLASVFVLLSVFTLRPPQPAV